MTRLTVTLYGCNITISKVVMLLQDLDNGNDRCWANGWLHGQGLALEGRLKAYPGRYDYCSQRYSNHHPQWYKIINATILSKHQSKLWKVLASVPVQDSALLEPLTSLGCAGDVIFVIDTSSLVVLVMSYFNLTSTNIVSVHNHASWQFDFQEQTTTWRLQIGQRWENINAAH